MKCMEYANANHVNIIPKENFEELALEVFNVIATNLGKSFGPLGSSATIFDGSIIEATKDGYNILKKYTFNNRYKKMIYNLIKAPCTKMNNTVGDGTTTAICLTNAIYQEYSRSKADLYKLYRLPRQFTQTWDKVVSEIIDRVNGYAKPIDPEDYDTIYHLAYVSSNGNHEIADNIAKTYKEAHSPAIKMKDSPTNKSYITSVEGFEFPTNCIDNCYVRNQDLTATEKDVVVMIFDHKIDTDIFNHVLRIFNEVFTAMNKRLVVIAPEYDKYMLEAVISKYVNYEFQKNGYANLILTQYIPSKLTPYQLEDLAVILKTKIITEEMMTHLMGHVQENNVDSLIEDIMEKEDCEFYRYVGVSKSVLLSCKNGAIFDPTNISKDANYIKALERANAELQDILNHIDYEKQSFASKVYEARSRIMQLEMKNYIYYIGADSNLQKQILEDTVEDVIKCVRSATKHGIIPGCQLTIIKSCLDMLGNIDKTDTSNENLLYEKIINIILAACNSNYFRVLNGPEGDGIIKIIENWQNVVMSPSVKEIIAKKGSEIINTSIENNCVFDLETLTYSPDIITSTETDTMVISAASELIKILISGNQCIFLDSDVTESHQDDVAMYV